jgi:hypothetical protein
MQKMGELLRVEDTINNIILETDGIPLIPVTNGNTPILSVKPKDVLPPEGAFFPILMRNSIVVVLLPDECNLLNIFFTIELIQLLEKESIILNT